MNTRATIAIVGKHDYTRRQWGFNAICTNNTVHNMVLRKTS